jgi:hypothetical protein
MLPSAIADSDDATLEALLARRASAGDWRDGAGAEGLRVLARRMGPDAAGRIVTRFDGSPAPLAARMRIHVLAADLAAESGRDAMAQEHLARARRLGADSTVEREAAARLTALAVRRAPTLEELDRVLPTMGKGARPSSAMQRLQASALLVRLLARRSGSGGGALFLAGEVARDSLASPVLALHLFRRAADTPGDPAAAAQALLAASALAPDSSAAYLALVRTRFVGSPAAMLIDGRDPAESPEFAPLADRLRATWANVTLEWADSLRAYRPPPAATDSSSRAGATPPA